MLNKLKDDILRLLKEDEEFRYAVVGLLGLQRLEDAIARLTDSHTELRGIVSRLSDAVTKMDSRLSSLESIIARLADIQARQEERLTKLEEAWIRSEERLTRVEERLTRVEERLEEHDRKFNAILEELSVHRAKLEEHDRKFNEIIEEIKDLRRISNEHTRILDEHTRILSELSISVGSIGRRLGKDMERMVLNIYKDQLMHIGIDPNNAKRFEYIDKEGKYGRKGKEYEFDIVVSNEHTDVLEVKAHTQKDDVEWFYDNVEAIRALFDKPLRRKVIVTVHVDEDALYRADNLGIKVIYGNIIRD